MDFVNNLLKKVSKIDIPKNSNCETANTEHHNLRRDFVRSKHVIILNGDVKSSYIFVTNEIVQSIIVKNNSEIIQLVKTKKNKKSCAGGMVIKNNYVPINSNSTTFCKILRADKCQAALGQNNQCVAMSSAALIMACIKSPLNWVRVDINTVLNQGNILYERSVNYLRSTNYSIDGRGYLSITNILRETILFNRKITFSTASCLSFTGRGKKARRNEINFGFVSLSEALNRLVNEHQFLILIANERASSIIHHDGVFFLFDPHSMDQNGRYCSNGVSCMLMFNTLVDLIKHLQANQVCNNAQFQLDGVNISVENLSDNNSDISTTRKNVKGRLSKIVKKEPLHLSKNKSNKKVNSKLNEEISLLKIRYDKCKKLNEKKKIQVQLNRLEKKSIATVEKNCTDTLKINEVVDNNSIKNSLVNNEEPMEVDICENNVSEKLIDFDVDIDTTLKEIIVVENKIKKCRKLNDKKKLQMHLNRLHKKMSIGTVKPESNDNFNLNKVLNCDLNKNVTINNKESMEVDICEKNISKDPIEFNVDIESTLRQVKNTKKKIKACKSKPEADKLRMQLVRSRKKLPESLKIIAKSDKLNDGNDEISVIKDVLVNFVQLDKTRKAIGKKKLTRRIKRLSSNIIKCVDVSLDKNSQVDSIVKALDSIQVANDSTKKKEKSKKSLKKQKLFPARNEEIIPNEHYLGPLSTGCEHCQAMSSTFMLHGEAKRVINTAVPENKDNLSYGQLYFYGPDVAEDIRNKNVNAFNEISVISNLTHIISKINMLALSHKHFGDYIREQEIKQKSENKAVPMYKLVLRPPANKNDRVRNLPEVTETAVIFQSEDEEVPDYNVLLCNKTGKLETLSHYSPLKDPATYPLFFPTGAFGWEEKKTYKKGNEQRSLTKLVYYQNLIAVRPSFNPLHHGGLLFQLFVVDAYTAIERDRLNYVIKLNKELKQKNNKQIEDLLEDYLIGDEDNEEAAKKVRELNFLAVTLVQEDLCI
uniref:Peptidase C76 domain-containing protein n=1 Tax=Strongyloides papillosus TaxID=174720 RepID=A0A0N5BRE0_STREA